MRSLLIAAILFSLPASGNQEQRQPHEQNANTAPAFNPSVPVTAVVNQQPPPLQTETTQTKTHNWYEWFWPPIWSNWALVLVAACAAKAAFVSLGEIKRQADSTEKAANAARDNALALIKAERAWIFAEIERTPGSGRGILNHKETSISIRVKCRNVGNTPAWITGIRAKFEVTKELPQKPQLDISHMLHAEPFPIAHNDFAFTSEDQVFTVEGVQGLGFRRGDFRGLRKRPL
jgi:hypothetical protein